MLKVTVKGPKRIDLKLPVTCPNCGSKTEIAMRDAVPGSKVDCACGASITLAGDDGRKVQAAMDGLVNAINRIGRR